MTRVVVVVVVVVVVAYEHIMLTQITDKTDSSPEVQ